MSKFIEVDSYIEYCDKHWIPLNVDAVNAQPTADVVEVVHGEWKWTGSNNLRCSECGDIAPTSYNYCPNCGADMRGGTE